jgi:nicotinamide mononucleotide (NMN) deamidase PncC
VSGKDCAEIAKAMADLARRKLNASIGIGIEGESQAESESGMVPGTIFIAIDDGQAGPPQVQSYSGRLYQMKRRAAYYALFDLMKLLRSK